MPNGTQPHHPDQRTRGIDCPPIRGKFPFRRSIGRIDTRLCSQNDFAVRCILHAKINGFALAAINFRVEDATNGEIVLTTETRIYATDASTKRKFAAYWRTIYPASALIRVMWLRAIRHRAELAPR